MPTPPSLELINVIEEGSCLKTKPNETSFLAEISEKTFSTMDEPFTYIELVMEDLDEVSINLLNPNHKFLVGLKLDADQRQELVSFLAEHLDCITWSHEDLTGIDPLIYWNYILKA